MHRYRVNYAIDESVYRGGKSTHDPPYPTRTGKTPTTVQEEKKDDEVEEVEPQA